MTSSPRQRDMSPPWLHDVTLPPAPFGSEAPAAPTQKPGSDWLQTLQRTPTTGSLRTPTAAPQTTSSLRVPPGGTSWLQNLAQQNANANAESSTAVSATSENGQADLPNWLRELNVTSPNKPATSGLAQPASSMGKAPLPDWFSDSHAAALESSPEQFTSGARSTIPDFSSTSPAPEENGFELDGIEPFQFEGAAARGTPQAPAFHDEEPGLPSWLAETANAEEEEQTPAWMRTAPTPPQKEVSTPPIAPAAVQPSAAPTFMNMEPSTPSVRSEGERQPPRPADAITDSVEELPGWLRNNLPPATNPEPVQETVAPARQEASSWHETPRAEIAPERNVVPSAPEPVLPWETEQAVAPTQSSAPVAPAMAAPPAKMPSLTEDEGELPPWLQEDNSVNLSTVSAPKNDATLPVWLRGAEVEPPRPEAPAPFMPADELPAFLAPATSPTAKTTPAASQPPKAPTASPAGQQTSKTGGLGRSRDESRPTPRRSAFNLFDADSESDTDNDFIGGTDLPEWLRTDTKPTNAVKEEDSATTNRMLNLLLRLGVEEEEEEEGTSTIAAPLSFDARHAIMRSAEHMRAVNLVRGLVAAPFPTTPPARAVAKPSLWQQAYVDLILGIALLAALIIGVLIPSVTTPMVAVKAPPTASVQQLVQRINTLDNDDVVLIAYEWDAQRRSELTPLEQSVISHLIQRKVRMLIMSTDPQGAVLSFDLREALLRAHYNPAGPSGKDLFGVNYLLLGYQPGGDIALRGLAQNVRGVLRHDFRGMDVSDSALATDPASGAPRFSSLKDIALVVVMADQPQNVQGWVEQVYREAPTTPMAFLMPFETAAQVQPYLSNPNIYGLAGKPDALAYSHASGAPVTDLRSGQPVNSNPGFFGYSIMIFTALLLVGSILGGILRLVQRRLERE